MTTPALSCRADRTPGPRRLLLRTAALAALLLAAAPAVQADDKDARADAACAAMGEGFKRVPGSNTCLQISGSVGITVGTGRSLVNAPNQGFGNTPTPPSPPTGTDSWMRTR